jgi:hypothetical protein
VGERGGGEGERGEEGGRERRGGR